MTNEALRLSVVIATYRRAAVLRETLLRLNRQTLAPDRFEVVVADDGSPDDTSAMIAALTPELDFELRYLRHENHGPGYTENAGIRAARHEIVLLIADDIWADAGLLAEHLAWHAREPAPHVGVLGRVSPSPDLPPTVLHEYWDPFQYDRFRHGVTYDGLFFMACNVSVKKDFLVADRMFAERRAAAHEDIELGYRLAQRGLRLVYNADAHAVHHHAESLEGICKRAYERGRNFDLLLDTVPAKQALPLYKICDPRAGLRGWLTTLPRDLPRRLVFNRLTVPGFWQPVLAASEHSRVARVFASGAAYRGVAGYHFRRGFRDMLARSRPGSPAAPAFD